MTEVEFYDKVGLYLKHGKNKRLKTMFSRGYSEMAAAKLKHELTKLQVPQSPTEPVPATTAIAENALHPPKPSKASVYLAYKMEELPEKYHELYKELIEADTKARQLHMYLSALVDDEKAKPKREELAASIVALKDRVVEINYKLDLVMSGEDSGSGYSGQESEEYAYLKELSEGELRNELQKTYPNITKSTKRVEEAQAKLEANQNRAKTASLTKKLERVRETLKKHKAKQGAIKKKLNEVTG